MLKGSLVHSVSKGCPLLLDALLVTRQALHLVIKITSEALCGCNILQLATLTRFTVFCP